MLELGFEFVVWRLGIVRWWIGGGRELGGGGRGRFCGGRNGRSLWWVLCGVEVDVVVWERVGVYFLERW